MIKNYSKWLTLLATVGLLGLVTVYNGQKLAQQSDRPLPEKEDTSMAADVGVIKVKSDTHAVLIEAFGAAQSHHHITLTAQVSGRVSELSEAFETGSTVSNDELLLELEDSDYRAALASAENDLANARVDLLEAQREARQAQSEWYGSGMSGEPDSPLVLHEPQVRAAEAAAAMAEASAASARKNLEQTRVRAPFDALIVSRSVAPGSYLQSGGEVAELYSADRVEIALPLSQRDWSKLPDLELLEQGDWPVTLTSVETGHQWQGYIQRTERHLDDTTRQQSVVAALDWPLNQSPMLTPGTFVRAEIKGRAQENLWRLPSSSLSQRGEIWYEADGVLANFAAEPVASDDQAIYIRPPESLHNQTVSVLTHPLSTYMPGMAANPVEKAND